MIHREYRELELALVNEPPAPTRLEIHIDTLHELKMSIAERGQLQPGGVVRNADRYDLVYGHRRYLALKDLGALTYCAYVYDSTSEAMLGAQLDENVVREDLTPVEEAYWFAQLADALGDDTDALAARLHKSRDYVEGRLNLLTGDPRVLEALKAEKISLGVARALNAYADDGDRLVLLDAAAAGGATLRLVTQWIAERKALSAARCGLPAIDPTVAPTFDGAAAPETVKCLFCQSDQHVYLMRPFWIHNVCEDILRSILDRHLGGAHATKSPEPVAR